MSVLKLKITSGRAVGTLDSQFETAGGNQPIANRIINFITSLMSGTELAQGVGAPPSINIRIQNNEVQAHATLTCVTVVATNTVVINGVVFTAVDSGPSTNEFVRVSSNTTTATNLAAAINASATALIPGYVTASSALGVVTVTSAFYGLSGNQCTLSTTGGTITASSTRLVSGAEDATAQTLNF